MRRYKILIFICAALLFGANWKSKYRAGLMNSQSDLEKVRDQALEKLKSDARIKNNFAALKRVDAQIAAEKDAPERRRLKNRRGNIVARLHRALWRLSPEYREAFREYMRKRKTLKIQIMKEKRRRRKK